MTTWSLYALSGVAVLALALHGVFAHEHVMGKILATNLMASGVFLIFVAIARRAPSGPPDPVPLALVLTGIVVSVSGTALALALLRRLGHEPDPERSPTPPFHDLADEWDA